jgi:hypothetical protein
MQPLCSNQHRFFCLTEGKANHFGIAEDATRL